MKEHLSNEMETYLKQSYSDIVHSKEFSRKDCKQQLDELFDMIRILKIPSKYKESLTQQIKELMISSEEFGNNCGIAQSYREILDKNEKARKNTEKKVAS